MNQKLKTFSSQVIEILPLLFREFLKREDNELSRGQITCQQMVMLDLLTRRPRSTMKEISAALSVKMSSATVAVDRLIRQRMLARDRDAADRRRVWVRITPRGRKVVKRVLAQKRLGVEHVFGRLTDRERDQYLSVLLKVRSFLKEAKS